MIEKVLVIVYKMKGDKPLFFIGCRPETGLCQPITGHKDEEDKDVTQTVRREVCEEIGVENYCNFINLKESFIWKNEENKEVKESVFAIEVKDLPLKLEKREFASYEFLPLVDALKKVKYESHGKYLKKVAEVVRTKNYPKIFVIVGPGGSGKGTIIKGIADKYGDIAEVAATATTRPKRPGEKSKYRIFVSGEEFNKLFDSGKLIEKNFFKENWYGAPKDEVYKILEKGKNVVVEVDLNGLQSFKKIFSNVISVFIDAKVKDFEKRMTVRGAEKHEEIRKRMKITEWELQNKHLCDYIVENREGRPQEAIEEVKKIIDNKRSNMKSPTTIIIFIVLIGLVLGGILLSSPPKSQAPTGDSSSQQAVKEDVASIYRDGGPRIGSDNAKVKIAVFSDYLCPYCKTTHEILKNILSAHPNDVALYHRNFIVHPEAQIMAKASEAAAKQGKFAEADDAIFAKYQTADEATMVQMAQDIGLNVDQFKSDLTGSAVTDAVTKDNDNALALNLGGTPSIYVNGKFLEDPSKLEATVNDLLK